jgi:hypothetical protein
MYTILEVCPSTQSPEFIWSAIAYFALVAWGVLFSLAERIGTRSMWHIPKAKLKRWALASMVPAIILAFSNRPDKIWIVVLVAAFLFCLAYGLSDYLQKPTRNVAAFLLCFSLGSAVIGLGAWHAWPVSVVPFISIKIEPSVFPVSVSPHSVLSILPLHPYQTFTDTSSELHVYENPCSIERPWPSQKEIDSKSDDSHEEVRHIKITNHAQETIESGKIAFIVRYNQSFGGGCMAPPKSDASQTDVISIPTLDSGKAFEFVSVNQTNKCAWLLPPDSITVKMANDDRTETIPLKLEPINIPNWISTPFGPTSISWEGVPTRNPGYGMVRSGASCDQPTPTAAVPIQRQHDIQVLPSENVGLSDRADVKVTRARKDKVSSASPPTTAAIGNVGEKTEAIQSAVRRVLRFPDADIDPREPRTITEALLVNQLPRKLFDILIGYDDNSIAAVPNIGPSLRGFLHNYYQFEQDTRQIENQSLGKIGALVTVRFPQAWQIYLRYAILRFSGNSKEQIIAGGSFLNYDITWDDAERVYGQLASDPVIAKGFSDAFSRYNDFVQTTDRFATTKD